MVKFVFLVVVVIIGLSVIVFVEILQGVVVLFDVYLDCMLDIGLGLVVVVVDVNDILLDCWIGI